VAAVKWPGRRNPFATRAGVLVAISVVAGLLLAGMMLPIVGGIGLIARTGADDFESLPSELDITAPPQVSRILAADGSTIATFYFQDRVTVPLAQVPMVMQRAIVAVEDVRFYEHHGVDFKGALRALVHNGSAGTVQQGGSTLTQQYVKNVLIETAQENNDKKALAAAHADTLTRKIREARYALALEKKYSKAQILDGYLNIAYFGDGAYGVGTAARHYFDEPVQKLTLAQSALLAGLVQSPEAYDPALHPQLAKERRDIVLGQMLKYHFISPQQYNAAVASKIRLRLHQQGNGCEASSAPYFCDYVLHVIQHSPAFGARPSDRLDLLKRGGLTIRTTLEPKVQRAADHAVRKYVFPHDRSGVAGTEAIVQPGTGKVLAISVSKPYGQNAKRGQNTIDYAVDRRYGGGSSGFPMGSTFKLFVLSAALKQGISVGTLINSPPRLVNFPGYTDCAGNSLTYSPGVSNAEPTEGGRFNLLTGTWESVNTFYAQLEQRTGLCAPVRLAESMGMRQENGAPPLQLPSFVLGEGGHEYSVLDLAGAYATMAAHGRYCAPMAIASVTDQAGRLLDTPRPHCTQVVAPGLADTVTNILEGVLTRPGATAAGVGDPGRPAAAKTGTADGNVTSAFAGYVPQMAAAVAVGDPRHLHSLNGLTIGGRTYGEVFGATIAGPIWHDTFVAALKGQPVIPFPPADPQFENGKSTGVPDVGGLTVKAAKKVLQAAGFDAVVSPTTVDSLFPKGTVASTSPPGGSTAPPGETVTIFLSNGHAPPPPSATPTPSAQPTGSPSPSESPSGGPTPSTTASPTPSPSCTPHRHGPPHC
jgi:membrane peptidoglycan carboxypeptidase